jgi:GMP synthase (glutamine-hydrolysing)
MIAIIDCGSSKTPIINDLVYEHIDTVVIPLFEFKREQFDHVLGFIISGAPILLTEIDNEPYLNQFTWLTSESKPVLGICFGHQMLGLSFGSQVNRQKEDRDWQEVEVLVDCPLFDKLPDILSLMEDHCEAVGIPADFIHVAVSDATINEAMMHKERKLYGVQFHPEVSGMHGAVILENFVHICLNSTEQHAK